MENTAQGGMSRDVSRVLYDSQDTQKSAVLFVHTSIGGALTDTLYFLVVWLREILKPLQVAVIRVSVYF